MGILSKSSLPLYDFYVLPIESLTERTKLILGAFARYSVPILAAIMAVLYFGRGIEMLGAPFVRPRSLVLLFFVFEQKREWNGLCVAKNRHCFPKRKRFSYYYIFQQTASLNIKLLSSSHRQPFSSTILHYREFHTLHLSTHLVRNQHLSVTHCSATFGHPFSFQKQNCYGKFKISILLYFCYSLK